MLWFIVPAGAEFNRMLLGSAIYNHDAVLNAGILEWGYRSLWNPSLHFFDWPVGFPLKNGLAGTENLIGWQTVYSPMRALGASVPASYNLALLASLIVAGVSAAALALRLGASVMGAMIGGFVFAFNPFHLDHLIHIQTMAICWSPLAILGLDESLERRSARALVMLAAGIIMTIASGMYFGVFLAIVLPVWAIISWLLGRHRFSLARVGEIVAVVVACAVILLPILTHYFTFARDYGRYPHESSELALSALSIRSLIQVPRWLAVWGSTPIGAKGTGWFANGFAGVVAACLVIVGIVRRDTTRSKKNATLLILVAVICTSMAFGPTLQSSPGRTLDAVNALPLPGKLWLAFSAVRWPLRIYMYSMLSVSLLAAIGASSLVADRGKWTNPLGLLLIAILFIELRPSTWFVTDSLRIGNPMAISDAYRFLRDEPDRGGIVELPARRDSGLATPFATLYAYGSAGHLRGVIAYHGSMFPPALESLRVATHFLPAPEAIRMMQAHGVSRLVVHQDLLTTDSARSLITAMRSQSYPEIFSTSNSTVFSLKR